MNYIKTLDDHIHTITRDFETSGQSAAVAISDHINNVYCHLEDETALEAVTVLTDECDELIQCAKRMKEHLHAYGKEPSCNL